MSERKKVEVREENNAKVLYVDDKKIEVTLDSNSGTYSCKELPYSRYSNLEELGRDLAEN